MLGRKTHRTIYLVLLTLLGGCMVTSVWAANLMWVLLGVNWLFEGRWREKWQMARQCRLLQAIVAFSIIYTVGMLWTTNITHGFNVLQVKLPMLVVPLVVLTTKPVTGRARHLILGAYITTILVVSIIALVRMLTISDLPYRDAVPYISHIRFALNCCMVVYLLVGYRQWAIGSGRYPLAILIIRILLTLWMLVFLALIHSYTAFGILAVVSLVLLLVYYRHRWPLVVLWFCLAGAVVFLVGREVKAYYRLIPQASQPLPTLTAGGRAYEHYCDGIIENGNYINNYLCTDELRAEWQRRSSVPYDSVGDEGYNLQPTLVRYLNALGLTKDSVGVNALTDKQVNDIEHGIANPVYAGGNPLRKMVYVMLFEREYYVHTHAVQGFTMIQRLELWRATLDVVHDHLWFGVGTGDVDDALHARLTEMDSSLADTRKSTHSQYLGFLAAFGILGCAILLFFLLRAIVAHRSSHLSPVMFAWVLTVLISFLTEDTLDTLAGILFCTYFLSFRTSQCTNTTPSATESE
ncbi:MAG: O-antigen ligase family protein [Bacteroidales bacterium]|nr:O-antigen ligase family protein [Bacteroidales bacterium]